MPRFARHLSVGLSGRGNAALLFLYFLIFLFRFNFAVNNQLVLPENEEVTLRLCLDRQPYQKGLYQIIRVGSIVVTTGAYPEYFYGQKIEVIGRFEKWVTGNGKVEYSAGFPKILVMDNSCNRGKIVAQLVRGREYLSGQFSRFLPNINAGLLSGIIFGIQENLPQDFLQKLRVTGTIHIVVASGANLMILSQVLLVIFLRWWRRSVAIWIVLICLWLYALAVGAEPPIVRAGIMAGFIYAGQLFGRMGSPGRGLVIAAALMLFVRPLMLFDTGFQLSFAATAGLVWLSPRLVETKMFGWRRRDGLEWVAQVLAATLSAQLLTWPVVALNFGGISLVSLFANVAVSWLPSAIMILGGLFAVFSLIFSLLGAFGAGVTMILASPIWLVTQAFIGIVNFFARLDFGYYEGAEIGVLAVIVYYGLILLAIFVAKRER